MEKKKIWTIGHSTRSLVEFVDMLGDFDIKCLVDVRSMPGSRKFPQFNKEQLIEGLKEYNIAYKHIEKLGGRRKPNPDSHNTVWHNKSFQAYADYMETDEFEEGLQELKNVAKEKNVAIMCAEAVWWRCHRSLIADKLKADGWKVMHIMGFHQTTEHPYTDPAKVENGELHYVED